MTWVSKTTALQGDNNAYVFDIVSNGSVVVASGSSDTFGGSDVLMRSLDHGQTWSLPSVTPIDDGASNIPGGSTVCWSPTLSLFVATGWTTGGDGWLVCTSPDGDVWTKRFNDATDGYGVCCWDEAAGLFIVMRFDPTGTPLTSPNGTAWTPRASHGMESPNFLAHSQPLGMTVCVGTAGGSGATANILRSTDGGITWTDTPSPLDNPAVGNGFGSQVVWSDAQQAFFATGGDIDSTMVLRSYDGITWLVVATTDTPFFGFNLQVIGETKDGALLVTDNSNNGFSTADGGGSWGKQNLYPFINAGTTYAVASDSTQNYIGGQLFHSNGTPLLTVGAPNRIIYPPRGGGPPLWRYFLAALDGTGVTDLSKITSDRVVEVILNGPLSMTGTVPSDNPKAWIPYDGDTYNDPYLSEGTRLMWGFRRESFTSPYYTVRGATIVNLVEDTAEGDDARTRFVGWDPWHYMMSRPVTDIDGNLPGEDGLSFNDTKVSVIVCELLRNTIDNFGFAYIDAGDGTRIGEGSQYQDWGGSAEYGGFLAATPVIDWNIPQGTSVGQAWADLCAAGQCDIILNPIYEPQGRTVGTDTVVNFLVEISVYVQAGVVRDDQIFAWNLPGRSLMGLTRQQDGSSRVNDFYAFAGPGGTGGGQATSIDNDSITKYGVYLAQQFFPGLNGPDTVANVAAAASFAQAQVALRALGRQTVTFVPAPERSPRPWQDYQLGDRMPIWASKEKFRQLLSGST